MSGVETGFMNYVALPRHGKLPVSFPEQWPADQPLPGGTNVTFFDGHAELVALDRLSCGRLAGISGDFPVHVQISASMTYCRETLKWECAHAPFSL
jgi:prepilin-type processing-associated H-X9-DG protein